MGSVWGPNLASDACAMGWSSKWQRHCRGLNRARGVAPSSRLLLAACLEKHSLELSIARTLRRTQCYCAILICANPYSSIGRVLRPSLPRRMLRLLLVALAAMTLTPSPASAAGTLVQPVFGQAPEGMQSQQQSQLLNALATPCPTSQPHGFVGGFRPVSEEQLQSDKETYVRYANAALDTWLSGVERSVPDLCPGSVSSATVDRVTSACQQVVAGMNVKLQFAATLSCEGGASGQLQLASYVFQPLPGPTLLRGEPILPSPVVEVVARVQ